MSVGGPGAVAVTVLGTRHPLVAHLVGARAVEVQPGGFLRLGLGLVEGGHTALAGGWSGEAGGGEQQVRAKRSCRLHDQRTETVRHGTGDERRGLVERAAYRKSPVVLH